MNIEHTLRPARHAVRGRREKKIKTVTLDRWMHRFSVTVAFSTIYTLRSTRKHTARCSLSLIVDEKSSYRFCVTAGAVRWPLSPGACARLIHTIRVTRTCVISDGCCWHSLVLLPDRAMPMSWHEITESSLDVFFILYVRNTFLFSICFDKIIFKQINTVLIHWEKFPVTITKIPFWKLLNRNLFWSNRNSGLCIRDFGKCNWHSDYFNKNSV